MRNASAPGAPIATTTARTEVADRLQAIGTLGNHVSNGRVEPREAVDASIKLLAWALWHVDGGES